MFYFEVLHDLYSMYYTCLIDSICSQYNTIYIKLH